VEKALMTLGLGLEARVQFGVHLVPQAIKDFSASNALLVLINPNSQTSIADSVKICQKKHKEMLSMIR
jgi:hypothetical protein